MSAHCGSATEAAERSSNGPRQPKPDEGLVYSNDATRAGDGEVHEPRTRLPQPILILVPQPPGCLGRRHPEPLTPSSVCLADAVGRGPMAGTTWREIDVDNRECLPGTRPSSVPGR